MAAVAFDTLKFVETLEKAGVSREQASAIAVAVKDSHQGAELATKADLREVRVEMQQYESAIRSDLEKLELNLRGELRTEIGSVRSDMEKLETGLRSDIEKLELSLRGEIGSARSEIQLLKWMMGLLMAGVWLLILKAFF